MSNSVGNGKAKDANPTERVAEITCGLIMPISLLDNCTADHWAEVKAIIIEAVESISSPRFVTRLVSDADEIGVIQKRIVQNVYNSSMVVCDVSGKNPNVMFELGLRLAFDKPTVIIKDDKTDYSFDTGVIEHIGYPRDLRFARIVDFKKKLAEKISNTYKASVEDSEHSPFLKSFGQFHVASLAQSEVSPDKVMLEMLSDMQRDIQVLRRRDHGRASTPGSGPPGRYTFAEAATAAREIVFQWCLANKIASKEMIPPDAPDMIAAWAFNNLEVRPINLRLISRALAEQASSL